MTTHKEALTLALDALTATMSTHGFRDAIDEVQDKAITAIKEALAQPEQEPVAYLYHDANSLEELLESERKCLNMHSVLISIRRHEAYRNETPLYTTPPQRTWVGLTFDERIELAQDVDWAAGAYCEYAEKVEAELKRKNT